MVYNMPMRRLLVLVSLCLIAIGCTRPAAIVAAHVNNHAFYYNRYIDECVTVKGPPSCEVFYVEVNRYKAVIVEADAANVRGGKYPLQLKELKTQLKKVENARGH